MKQSGGFIWVDSEPGQGATFRVFLPRTDEAMAAEVPAPKKRSAVGTETVLLVEDEESVRLLSRALLEHLGYRVIEAADAEQAARLVGAYTAPIHLLLSDVVMPGESGPELYQRLKPSRPASAVDYVTKPFGREMLLQALRRATPA